MRSGLPGLTRANSATSSIGCCSGTARATRVLHRAVSDLKSNVLPVHGLSSILDRGIALWISTLFFRKFEKSSFRTISTRGYYAGVVILVLRAGILPVDCDKGRGLGLVWGLGWLRALAGYGPWLATGLGCVGALWLRPWQSSNFRVANRAQSAREPLYGC